MGMVANLVPLGDDALVELRVFPDIVSHHEESSLYAEFLERVKNEGGCLGDGTVIESQIDCLLMTVHSPVGLRIQPS